MYFGLSILYVKAFDKISDLLITELKIYTAVHFDYMVVFKRKLLLICVGTYLILKNKR